MTILFVLLIAALAGVVGVLILGMVSMVRGGEFNRKYGNKLMRARVILQGVAILLLMLVMWSAPRT